MFLRDIRTLQEYQLLMPQASMKLLAFSTLAITTVSVSARCRNQPGDAKYPSPAQWKELNNTVSGRLVPIVPFVGHCKTLPGGTCTAEQYGSSVFRKEVPGAMNYVSDQTLRGSTDAYSRQINWEQVRLWVGCAVHSLIAELGL